MCDILLSYSILQLTDRRKGMPIMLPFALRSRGVELLTQCRKSVMNATRRHTISGWLALVLISCDDNESDKEPSAYSVSDNH
jgi:hypothetical protein